MQFFGIAAFASMLLQNMQPAKILAHTSKDEGADTFILLGVGSVARGFEVASECGFGNLSTVSPMRTNLSVNQWDNGMC